MSFVSVTQAFNTTTSMGRLTLNVLLSFAQFEREVTGERIRDKIAASKKKGIWMGGAVPLGYRVENRALHVVEEQAAAVREVYDRYLELGSILRVKAELDARGILVPRRIDGAGRVVGGVRFSIGYVNHLLRSPLYVGRLPHKDRVHEGQHPAIVELATWDAVQAKLAGNARRHRENLASSSHLLIGRIRDHEGITLSPSHTQKGLHRYRYYVSQALQKGRAASTVRRIAAPELEAMVVQALRAAMPASAQPLHEPDLVAKHLTLVVVHPDRLELRLTGDRQAITMPWSPPNPQRRREIIVPPGQERPGLRPMKIEDRARILKAIATGRAWMDELTNARIPSPAAIASREILSERSVRMTLSLAHLAPSIVKVIIDGRLPRGIGIRDLADLPPVWAEQERALGM